MKLIWITQGGFIFENDGVRLVVDPYLAGGTPTLTRLVPPPFTVQQLRPDVLIATHDHLDHFDEETILAVSREFPNCRFAGPRSVVDHLAKVNLEGTLLDQPMMFGPLRASPVVAFHSDPYSIGLLIESDRRIYLTADTVMRPDLLNATQRLAGTLDALLVCINGRLGNMAWDEAVTLAKHLRPKMTVPMHFGLFKENTVDPLPFVTAVRDAGMKCEVLPIGQSVDLSTLD